ncbi:hypothetical protein GCM10007171_25890 [Dickeya fangzhongdai]|nr:hypothetical protein GCM10007171_25890 [Dickeya fangzhongdai]
MQLPRLRLFFRQISLRGNAQRALRVAVAQRGGDLHIAQMHRRFMQQVDVAVGCRQGVRSNSAGSRLSWE